MKTRKLCKPFSSSIQLLSKVQYNTVQQLQQCTGIHFDICSDHPDICSYLQDIKESIVQEELQHSAGMGMTHSTDRPLCASYVDATLHGSKYLDFRIKALKPKSRLSQPGLRSICYSSYWSDEKILHGQILTDQTPNAGSHIGWSHTISRRS